MEYLVYGNRGVQLSVLADIPPLRRTSMKSQLDSYIAQSDKTSFLTYLARPRGSQSSKEIHLN